MVGEDEDGERVESRVWGVEREEDEEEEDVGDGVSGVGGMEE